MKRKEIWSCHDKRHPKAPGSQFGDTYGAPLQMSCIRCGVHRLPAELQADARIKFQKRCIDRELCAVARGGTA